MLQATYSTKNYFDRCLSLSKALRIQYRFKPSWHRKARYATAFLKILVKLGLRPHTLYYFWRNLLAVLFTRVSSLETVVNLMAMYLHFGPQTEFVSGVMAKNIRLWEASPARDARVTEN